MRRSRSAIVDVVGSAGTAGAPDCPLADKAPNGATAAVAPAARRRLRLERGNWEDGNDIEVVYFTLYHFSRLSANFGQF